jgi:hypothetical protein
MRLVQFVLKQVLLLIVIIELVTLVKVLFMVLVKGATVSSSASALTLRYNVGANAYAIIGDLYFNWCYCC